MRTLSPLSGRLNLAPSLADRFIVWTLVLDYGPVLLRRPFGSRLTADTLPCPVFTGPGEELPPPLDMAPLI